MPFLKVEYIINIEWFIVSKIFTHVYLHLSTFVYDFDMQ